MKIITNASIQHSVAVHRSVFIRIYACKGRNYTKTIVITILSASQDAAMQINALNSYNAMRNAWQIKTAKGQQGAAARVTVQISRFVWVGTRSRASTVISILSASLNFTAWTISVTRAPLPFYQEMSSFLSSSSLQPSSLYAWCSIAVSNCVARKLVNLLLVRVLRTEAGKMVLALEMAGRILFFLIMEAILTQLSIQVSRNG